MVRAAKVRARSNPSTQPPPLPVAVIPQVHLAQGWPSVWWVGCHGGAGTSTLARLTGVGVDFGVSAWPAVQPAMPIASVVLVCRATAYGTWAATGAVDQWRLKAMIAPTIRLVGVVTVAASARRAPRIAVERLQLLAGWAPKVWRVGWVEALLAADDPRDVGVPPDVDELRYAVGRAAHVEARIR